MLPVEISVTITHYTEPIARYRPSGEKATNSTKDLCFIFLTVSPDEISVTSAILSLEPVARYMLSDEKVID